MSTKPLWGFVIGLSAGTVAGLLIAPKAGRDTLQDISDRGNQLRNGLPSKWESKSGHTEPEAQQDEAQEEQASPVKKTRKLNKPVQPNDQILAIVEDHRNAWTKDGISNPDMLPHRPRPLSPGDDDIYAG